MPSKQFAPPLPDVVPERDSPVVRCYAEHLEGFGLSDRKTGLLTGTARHVAIWLALNGAGLDKFDIRLVDRFMRHECHCPGWPRGGRKPGQHCRRFALRFYRHLLETGRAEVPPETEAGGHLAVQFRDFLEEREYARSMIQRSETLCRHVIVWFYLSDIPLTETNERVWRRFLALDCTCVHPGVLDNRPTGFAGSDSSGSTLRHFAAFLVDRNVIPAPKVPQSHVERWEHLDAFLHWLRQHRGLGDTSIEQYERRIRTLLPVLGDDPGAYDAARVRNTILGRLETASRGQVGGEASALRMYLRFLGSNGLCRPELVHAVPRLRGENLPRYVGQNDIERMIATCDVTTPMGMRTGQPCCCSPGLRCGPATSPDCISTTSTGTGPSSGSAASRGGRRNCRCRRMWATRCGTTSWRPGRATMRGMCFCAAGRRTGPCRVTESAAPSSAVRLSGPVSGASARHRHTCSGSRRRPISCVMAPPWRPSAPCSGTGLPTPPRSLPVSMSGCSVNWPSTGPSRETSDDHDGLREGLRRKQESTGPVVRGTGTGVDGVCAGIFPWVHVPNLGPHIVSIIRRKLPEDWRARYNLTPVLCETFVQVPPYSGTLYKASGWIKVGNTQGRGRYDRENRHDKPKKDIWLRPLRKDWKRTLNR